MCTAAGGIVLLYCALVSLVVMFRLGLLGRGTCSLSLRDFPTGLCQGVVLEAAVSKSRCVGYGSLLRLVYCAENL